MTESAPGFVHVIDDDDAVRQSLGALLRSEGFGVALHAGSAAFLAADRRERPACLLLDVRLAGEDGLDFQERMAAEGVTFPVIIITGHADVPMTVRGMKGGAVDLLPKPVDVTTLIAAVRAALELDHVRAAEEAEVAALAALHAALTPRERDVMALVVRGLMNKQIAYELSLQEITVKVHRGNLMRKLGIRTVPDLVRIAERLRIGSGPTHV